MYPATLKSIVLAEEIPLVGHQRPSFSNRVHMMRRIEFFLAILMTHLCSIAGDVPESTMSSKLYFKGMKGKEIEAFCNAGHGGTEVIAR